MPWADYQIDRVVGGANEQYIAKKKGVTYRLKRYRPPYPAGEPATDPKTIAKIKRCNEVLKQRQRLNEALKAAAGRESCFGYAEEVFLNTSADAPGVIEAVRVIEGVRSLDEVRKDGKALRGAMLGLAEALEKLHGIGIVHADLKPQNVLFVQHSVGRVRSLFGGGGGMRAVLIDFDRSYYKDEIPGPDDIGGTPGFLPPEVIGYLEDEDCEEDGSDSKFRALLSEARDIYALGALFHVMLTGALPAWADGKQEVNGSAVEAAAKRYGMKPGYLSDLLEAMLQPEPKERPAASEVHESLRKEEFVSSSAPFEELWPEHAEQGYAYAGDMSRYQRIRRMTQGEVHMYKIRFVGGVENIYSIQMMRNTGIVTTNAAPRPAAPSPASEDRFTLDGVLYERDQLWPEHSGYQIDHDMLRRWGYQALYRTTQGDKKGYAVFKTGTGYKSLPFAVLRQDRCVVIK